jgi:hypothetical protein
VERRQGHRVGLSSFDAVVKDTVVKEVDERSGPMLVSAASG